MQLSAQIGEQVGYINIQPYEEPEPILSKLLELAVELPDDRTFVDDQWPVSPSTPPDCQFRNEGPITLDIPITRYVGPTDPSTMQLTKASTMVREGLLSRKASLVIAAFDVDRYQICIDTGCATFDDEGDVLGAGQFEDDKVFLNGKSVGALKGWEFQGSNTFWSATEIEVDINLLKFPVQGDSGTAPDPAMNTVRIDIDQQGVGYCTSVAWAALHFKTVSPIILVHGNNSDPGFFDRQGFTGPLRTQTPWPFEGCASLPLGLGGCDYPIFLPAASTQANADLLGQQIPEITTALGVNSYHIVAHSKGGLDARDYLGRVKPQNDDGVRVLSYTSLSTPHLGSVGADLTVGYWGLLKGAADTQFVGFPDLVQEAVSFSALNDGHASLTTEAASEFHFSNEPQLSPDMRRRTVGADADSRNDDGVISEPLEFDGLARESFKFVFLAHPLFGDELDVLNAVYQVMRNTLRAFVAKTTITFTGGQPVTSNAIVGVPFPLSWTNDFAVNTRSALALGGEQQEYLSQNGRDHGSVADSGAAVDAIRWILSVEKTHENGDLR